MANTEKTPDLTPEARTALINFPSSRQGAPMPLGVSPGIVWELRNAGLVTDRRNLTRAGGIARDRVLSDALDAL